MLTLEEIQIKLKPMKLTYVAREIGVEYPLLWKIANNRMLNPPYDVVLKIIKFLESI